MKNSGMISQSFVASVNTTNKSGSHSYCPHPSHTYLYKGGIGHFQNWLLGGGKRFLLSKRVPLQMERVAMRNRRLITVYCACFKCGGLCGIYLQNFFPEEPLSNTLSLHVLIFEILSINRMINLILRLIFVQSHGLLNLDPYLTLKISTSQFLTPSFCWGEGG